jgi:GTP-binding protein HflX
MLNNKGTFAGTFSESTLIDNKTIKVTRAVLIGLVTKTQTEEQTFEYLDELDFLASTAGIVTAKKFWQKLATPDNKSYLGKGKLEEVAAYVESHKIDIVIIDDETSPSQLRNMEAVVKCRVMDRSMLILEIFDQRAKTAQARTQVELAHMQYMLPRLKGMWTHLERQRGGTGTRGGAGEKEIETDRRMAEKDRPTQTQAQGDRQTE